MAKRLLFDFRLMFRYPSEASAQVARELLGSTLQEVERPGEYWLRRAMGHYLLARFDDALRAIGLALSHDARTAEAHHLKGVCLQLLALEAAQKDAAFPHILGDEARQRFDLAKQAFQRALELNPDDEESRQMIVGLSFLLGEEQPGELDHVNAGAGAAEVPEVHDD